MRYRNANTCIDRVQPVSVEYIESMIDQCHTSWIITECYTDNTTASDSGKQSGNKL